MPAESEGRLSGAHLDEEIATAIRASQKALARVLTPLSVGGYLTTRN
jgi:hypothetical protein